LHTVLERLLEDVSFGAPEENAPVRIDAAYVETKLGDVVQNANLSSYIL
jgi:ATP-dependent HslUV protease ATP-binding subunit HslU